MKYKRMALAACALLLLLSATNLSAVLTDEHPRYHQHLERPAYTPCADHGEDLLCSYLPLVLIDTGGEAIPGVPIPDADSNIENNRFTTTADGSTLLRASVSMVDHAEGNNHPADTPTLQSVIDIRVRGNSSRYFDKHSYLVKTLTDDGTASRDVAMLGMDAFDEWALHGPYLDKTLIRNYMWYNLAGEIMDYAPNVRFCEVLLNGVYQGLYVMTETVSSGADARLKLTEPSKDTVQTSYALRLDRGSGNEVKNVETFSQYALRNLQDMDIVYPGTKWLTPERAAWIAQDFSDFEKSLYSYDYDTEPYAWWEQADMSSFVDYFILNEFTCNYDAGWLSTYIYRDVRGKYKMCIWDFNSACDNYSHPVTEPQHFELQHNVWYYMLSRDEKFINAVIDRYRELRQGVLSDAYLNGYMDAVVEWLGPAVERNFSVWGYTLEKDMMYRKAVCFGDDKVAAQILVTKDVAEIKTLGRLVSGYDESLWNGVRQIVVYEGLLAEFSQNSELWEQLKKTGSAVLAECAVKDRIWGIGLSMRDPDKLDRAKWQGQNLLGYALMMVREKLRTA